MPGTLRCCYPVFEMTQPELEAGTASFLRYERTLEESAFGQDSCGIFGPAFLRYVFG
jgi:hypothetical protein